MKVSTSQIFDRATSQMSAQQAKVAEMQTKLATGKQITRPSDNPEQAALIQRLTTALNRQDVYQTNLDSINSRLGAEESALMTAEDVMQRVRELAVQASSETVSAADRQIIAAEITALRDQLVSLANTTDVSGNYVFSGSKVRTQPFAENASGDLVYQGDQNRIMVDVSDQRQLSLNRPGNEVFPSVVREVDGVSERVSFFAVIDDFTTGLKANDLGQLQDSLSEISDLTQNLALLRLPMSAAAMRVADSQARQPG